MNKDEEENIGFKKDYNINEDEFFQLMKNNTINDSNYHIYRVKYNWYILVPIL